MKMKRLFILGVVLVFTGITHAADIFKVQDIEVASGKSVTLNIELINTTTNLMGWQCDISLPKGLTLELKTNGKPVATLGERFSTTEHTISSSCLANGDFRFIATSMDGEAIPGTAGTLFTVTLKADASLTSGSLIGTIKNIEFNTQDNQKVTVTDVTFSVMASGSDNPGDDNHSGDVPTEGLKVLDVNICAGENQPIDVLLNNTTTNLMGWQCDISLPKGLTLELKANGKPFATLGDRFSTTEHTISSSCLSNGDYRFIATSMEGETIPGTSGTLFTVTLMADESLTYGTNLKATVKNIEFNTQDNQKLTFDDVLFTIDILMPPVVTVSFSEEIDEGTDLTDTMIDNTYYTLDTDNGDGYNVEEQAIVLNSTTTEEQMNTVQEAEIGDETIQENYSGIIFEILAGNGTITVDAKTIGTHELNVQIGKNEPTKITNKERSTIDIKYSVKEPTYVYLYASSSERNAVRAQRAPSAAENSVLLYGYKVILDELEGDANGDGVVNAADIVEVVNYIMGHPTNKFDAAAADANSDKVVNAADIVQIVNIIMGK